MQRLIARLDIKNGIVIKGIQLEGQRRIGDPIDLASKYYALGADEIFLMDSVASLYGRINPFQTISDACKRVFIPITFGGGIRSIQDVEKALEAGADKVAINSAIVANPNLVDQISSIYGNQILVGNIEAKRHEKSWEVYVNNGRQPTGLNVVDWAKQLEQRGVGELLITSVDQEGTQRGFDIPLCVAIEEAVRIPVIASGGAGKIEHLKELVAKVKIQGIAIASMLHYNKASIIELKSALIDTKYY